MAEHNPRERAVGVDALKAFAHPLRMRMYDYLNEHGSATATQLAQAFGESTGQTSYHLRQLERHGFIADDPTRGTGRERWWRSVGFTMGAETLLDPAADVATRTLMQGMVAEQAQVLSRFVALADLRDPWYDASIVARQTTELTLDELKALVKALSDVLDEHADAARARAEAARAGGPGAAATGPDGQRRFRVYLDVVPLPVEETPAH
jgi:DNA-binding transcriptional ArsR family regulator